MEEHREQRNELKLPLAAVQPRGQSLLRSASASSIASGVAGGIGGSCLGQALLRSASANGMASGVANGSGLPDGCCGPTMPRPPLSSASGGSSCAVKAFKAQKHRKSQEFITAEQAQTRPAFEHQFSEVNIQLLDEGDTTKLLAGVSRLIFRHVREGQPQNAIQRSGSAALGQQCRLRTADFDRDLFFETARIRTRCCCRRRRIATSSDSIFQMLQGITAAGSYSKELVVLSAIYIERLIDTASISLTFQNWEPIFVAALLLASKVWEDIHSWNSDFSTLLGRAADLKVLGPLSLYRLESRFLQGLGWRAHVSGELYAAYYFSLKDADTCESPRWSSRRGEGEVRSFSWCCHDADKPMIMVGFPSWNLSSSMSRGSQLSEASDGGSSSSPSNQQEARTSQVAEAPDLLVSNGGCAPQVQAASEIAPIDDRWFLNRHNPHVGTFRHAQRSAPPSRHINARRSWLGGLGQCRPRDDNPAQVPQAGAEWMNASA
mmetsp:Transcript_122256/g.260890  ORF Transcript_122256/g.260890 Transcript_122256/m.260890 type:complete len:491 (-) Transcript_122256:60-1532(-)